MNDGRLRILRRKQNEGRLTARANGATLRALVKKLLITLKEGCINYFYIVIEPKSHVVCFSISGTWFMCGNIKF